MNTHGTFSSVNTEQADALKV